MTLTFLGTSSGLPTPARLGQTIVLTLETTRDGPPAHYILDAGDGASSQLARRGFRHPDVRGILVSHMHADHHCGMIQLMKTAMHKEKQELLTVYAPAEGIEPLRAYLAASYLYDDWLGYPVEWRSLGECVAVPGAFGEGLTLRAWPNSHLRHFRERAAAQAHPEAGRRSFESYSLLLEAEGRRVVYAGNVDGPRGTDELAVIPEPWDLLIAELAHVDPVELGRFLSGRRIGRTLVTHYHPKWDDVPDAELMGLIEQGARDPEIAARVTLVRDGEQFVV